MGACRLACPSTSFPARSVYVSSSVIPPEHGQEISAAAIEGHQRRRQDRTSDSLQGQGIPMENISMSRFQQKSQVENKGVGQDTARCPFKIS